MNSLKKMVFFLEIELINVHVLQLGRDYKMLLLVTIGI
jgi:hypothetical protein